MADWERIRQDLLASLQSSEDWTAIVSEYGTIRFFRDHDEALNEARRKDMLFTVRVSGWTPVFDNATNQ